MSTESESAEADRARRGRFSEFAEDAVGFGGQELRLTRDLLLRPAAVMDAYDARGGTAGGLYPKPMRYYLTLMGIYLLLIALLGGFEGALSGGGMDVLWGKLAVAAGKSQGEFMADLDQWYSLISVPITAAFFGGAAFLLIRRWSPADDQQDFRQTFSYLNAYSVVAVPFGLASVAFEPLRPWMLPITFLLLAVTFARVGAGRWWRTRRGAWGKGALMLLVNLVAILPAGLLMMGIAAAAARYLP